MHNPLRPTLMTVAVAVACALALPTADARAERADQFLTIGGGYNPSGNQVSLEKNVLFYQRLLAEEGLSDRPHTILFADGDDPGRDTQSEDTITGAPPMNVLLAMLFGSTKTINHIYRDHQIPRQNGPSSVATIDQWFNDTGCKLDPSDRVLIYFTGHGGHAEPKDTQNTSIMLWNNASLRVKEFVQRLDKVNAETPVVLLMVQCYSGGYANVIFNEGDPAKGLSAHNRAGFFATVHDRTAAGCTPDINEANYQDYSTHFFAALHGQTRTGQPVERPDFDGDGVTDFAEAHAYTLITSDSIDISIKTSDLLLRKLSTTDGKLKDKTLVDPLTATSDYPKLLAAAEPCEKAALEGLSARLELTGDDRTARAADLLKQAEQDQKKAKDERKKLFDEWDSARKELAKTLKQRYPELENPFHPWVHELIAGGPTAERFMAEIKADPRYQKMEQLEVQINKLDEEDNAADRRWVKLRRFQYIAESVALAANLPQVADEATLVRYRKLIEAEHATLKRRPTEPHDKIKAALKRLNP